MLIEELRVKISAEMGSLEKAMGDIKGEMSSLQKRVQATEDEVTKMNRSATSGMNSVKQATNGAEQSIGKIKGSFSEFTSLLDKLSGATGKAFDIDVGQTTKTFKATQVELQKLEDRYDAISQKMNDMFLNDEHASDNLTYRALAQELANVDAKILETKEALSRFNAQLSFRTPGTGIIHTNEKLEELKRKAYDAGVALQEARKKLDTMAMNKEDFGSDEFYAQQQEVVALTKEYDTLVGKIQEAQKEMSKPGGTNFTRALTNEFPQISTAVDNVKAKIGTLWDAFKTTKVGGVFSGIASTLGTIGNLAVAAAKDIAVIGKAGVKAGSLLVQGFAKGVQGIAAVTSKANELMKKMNPLTAICKRLGKSFTTLGSKIKTAFIYSAVNSFFKEIKDKVGTWLSTNEQMKSSLASLRGAWTSAFAPAVQAIIPILQKICAWATSAANAFASLIALLTGKSVSTFRATAEGMENAAKASDDMAASAGGAGAAAEEAQKELAGFDELEVLSDDKDSGGGGGGAEIAAETASELSDLFDIGKFDSWGAAFSALLDKLISKLPVLDSALQKVAEGLNWFSSNLLEAFTFPGVLEKVQTLATGLADCINHFMDAIDWDQLGQAIGAGFNLLINFITEFIYGIDWQGLGSHFAEGINGMLSRIDFTEVGKGLVAKFNVIWQTLLGFVTTLDWTQLGTKLKDGINGAIKNIDLAAASKTISEGVKGITKALTTMFDGIDVNQAKSKIKSFFDNLDIGGMINGLVSTIESAFKVLWPIATTIWTELLNALTTGIKNTNWAEVGIMLGEMVNQLAADLPNIVQSLVDAIPALIEGILTALITFIGTVDIGGLVMGIMDGVARIIAAIDVPSILQSIGLLIIELITQIPGLIAAALGGIADILGGLFEALGMDTIAGFFYGIGDALKDVVGWCKEHIVDPVVNAVKNLLGIHSPSTVFAEIGTDLIGGLLEGITKTWETITQFLTGAFTKMKTMFSQAWDNIKSTAKQKWDALKENVTQTVTNIRDFAVSKWENIRSEVESKTEQMKSAVKSKWEEMKSKVTEFTETIKTEVGKKWDTMKTNVTNLTENVKATVQEKWENMKSKVTEKTENLKKDIGDKWENLKGDLSEKTEVIRGTVEEKWNTMKSKVDEATGGLVSAAEAKFGEMKTNVTKVATDIHTAVKTDFENLKNDGDTSFSNMRTLVTGYFDQMKTTLLTDAGTIGQTLRQDVAGAADTIGSAFGTMWSKVSNIFGNLVEGIKDVARNVHKKATEIWNDITKSNNAADDIDTDNGSGPGYRVPGMASGGVVTSPTLALVGEYSGAKSNPEIVTPESLLTSIVSKGNDDLIGVWLQTTRQIIQAIDNKDLDVAIGDTAIAQSVVRSNNSSIRRTGKPLLATI